MNGSACARASLCIRQFLCVHVLSGLNVHTPVCVSACECARVSVRV